MKRKIISVSFEPHSDESCIYSTMYAVCNDGTVWYLKNNTTWTLSSTPEIPQKKLKDRNDKEA